MKEPKNIRKERIRMAKTMLTKLKPSKKLYSRKNPGNKPKE